MPEQEEDKEGRIVEFPEDAVRLPPERLPAPVGRIVRGHPLRRPLTIAILVLAILFAAYVVFSLFTAKSRSDPGEPATFTGMYHDPGCITYQGERLEGWFLDPDCQHFQAEDGRRFTYVDPHAREGFPVTGHWRLME